MKISRNVTQGLLVAGSLLLAIGLLTGTAQARFLFNSTITVKCAKGETITRALTRGLWAQLRGRPLTIIVRGTCHENVTIKQDDVTLLGDPDDGGTVIASDPALDTISIQGAKRVVINNLTVQGSNTNGIHGSQGASFTVENNSIIRENRDGIRVSRGSRATIEGSIVGTIEEGTAVVGNRRDGVLIVGGTAFVVDSWIQSNGRVGINVVNGGSVIVENNDIKFNGLSIPPAPPASGVAIREATGRLRGGNTIQGNGAAGVVVAQGSLTISGDTIESNTFDGISASNNASLNIFNALITKNIGNGISLFLHSTLIIGGNSQVSYNTIGGISLQRDSGLYVQFPPPPEPGQPPKPPVLITENDGFGIFCADSESSFDGDIRGVTGNHPPSSPPLPNSLFEDVYCTGFYQEEVLLH